MGVSYYSVGVIGVQLRRDAVFKDVRVKRRGFEHLSDDFQFDPASGRSIWEDRPECIFSDTLVDDGDEVEFAGGKLTLDCSDYDGSPEFVYIGLRIKADEYDKEGAFCKLGPMTVEDVRVAVKELFDGFGLPFKDEEFGLWVVTKAC